MSSREIAELVEAQHGNVRISMERLKERGLITFFATQEKTGGRPTTLYHVNQRDSYVVEVQLSPEFTAQMVDRWQELEAQVAKPTFHIPTTLHEALRLAADEKGTAKVSTPRGGVQTVTTVNKSGLYAVILRSKKPEARVFRKWVTSEVLPSIRKGDRCCLFQSRLSLRLR